LIARDTARTPAEIKEIIQKTAEDQVGDPAEDTPGWDQYYGWGRINAYEAFTYNPTGLEDNRLVEFNIYPNPVKGYLKCTWNPQLLSVHRICLYSSLGQQVMLIRVDKDNAGVISIDLSGQNEGLYLVEMDGEVGRLVRKVLVMR